MMDTGSVFRKLFVTFCASFVGAAALSFIPMVLSLPNSSSYSIINEESLNKFSESITKSEVFGWWWLAPIVLLSLAFYIQQRGKNPPKAPFRTQISYHQLRSKKRNDGSKIIKKGRKPKTP